MKTKTLLALAVVAPMLWLTQANADITLTDMNSVATIDPTSQAGMHSWTINGVNQLFQQWFWYRIGADGGESAINTISTPSGSQTSRTADIRYSNELLTVDLTYQLTGGTVGQISSDIGETIRLINNSGRTLDLHFFQYSDFDLAGTIGNDTVRLVNANTVDQSDPAGSTLSETIVTPGASRWEVNTYANTLNSLNDGSPTTLSNASGPVTGDATWAFEWDVSMAPGATYLISKDKNITYLPDGGSTLILLGAALGGLALLRRRRD